MKLFTFIQFKYICYIAFFVSLINACSHHRVIDYIRAGFTVIFSMFFMYFAHVFQHKYNDSIYGKMHTAYHHNPKYKHIWYAKLIELFNNLQLLIFILVNTLIKKFTNIEMFSNYILVFLSLYYLWIHNIEYHIHSSCRHRYHHKFDNEENINHSSEIKNYGPSTMDKIFNTYHDCNDNNNDLMSRVRNLMILYIAYHATILIYKIKI